MGWEGWLGIVLTGLMGVSLGLLGGDSCFEVPARPASRADSSAQAWSSSSSQSSYPPPQPLLYQAPAGLANARVRARAKAASAARTRPSSG